jgi:hypothetical protein
MKNTVLCSLVEFNLKFRGRGCFLFRTIILSLKPETVILICTAVRTAKVANTEHFREGLFKCS